MTGKTTVGVGIIAATIIGAIIYSYITYRPSPPEKQQTTSSPAPTAAQGNMTEALVLVKECITPCSATLGAWRFKVRTDGNALKIKFPGIDHEVDHPAEGNVPAPKGVQTGEVEFRSSNEAKPNIQVWLYKKVSVPQ